MSANLAYQQFLARKAIIDPPTGLTKIPAMPKAMFPFQADVVRWSLKRGRAAIFAGTGLGKTLMQLAWADAVQRHTGKPVLILTPLAVAQQTVAEAALFGIEGVAYAKDHAAIATRIVVTNYDRLDKFGMGEFGAIVLDESSCIKSHDSKTRIALIEVCRDTPFKLACTATPAPNDWVELGNHAQFLGVMSEKEMLAMFFVHDGSVRAGGGSDWRLKSHAEHAFWEWVSSWAAVLRSPADLGYDDDRYILPALHRHQITVQAEHNLSAGNLFPMEARTLQDRLGARRDSIKPRTAAAIDIVNAAPSRPWLIWCHLNTEQEAMEKAFGDRCISVYGKMKGDEKVSAIHRWLAGERLILISKPSIMGWGLNFQHCADMVFVGLNDSFEEIYQAIRRCWRFGQKRAVNAYMVASEREGAVVANVEAKERAYEAMGEAMAAHTRELVRRAMRSGRLQQSTYHPKKTMELPTWLAA